MLKKKQVATLVGIAVISFLIGTLFNMNFVVRGGDGSPWDRVWKAISELQDRVSALEEDTSQSVKRIPFNGMTMSYQFYDNYHVQGGEVFTRPITFYGNSSEPDYIWAAGFIGMFSPVRTKISVDTRKIVGEDSYSAFLFPTDMSVGDEVITYWFGTLSTTVTIIGNRTISVMGKQVDAWIAYDDPDWAQYTMYYEMKTGILLGGTFVSYSDETLYSRSLYLVTTNAPLL